MKEKCCIFYFYATLFSFICAFCYFQTAPLGVRKGKATIIPFLLFVKTTFSGLPFLFPPKASFGGAHNQPSGKPTVRFETSEKFFLSPQKKEL